MPGYRFLPQAIEDLDEIWERIAQDNLDAAERLIDEFESACQSLAQIPLLGVSRPDLTHESLRFLSVRRYLIVYDPSTMPIRIIAILHGMRDVRTIDRIIAER